MARRKSIRGKLAKTSKESQADSGHAQEPQKSDVEASVDEPSAPADQHGREQGNSEEYQDTQAERMRTRQDANPERKIALQQLMEAFREGDFDSDPDDMGSIESAGEDESGTRGARMTRTKRVKTAKLRKEKNKREPNEGEGDSDYVQIAENDEAEEEEEEEDDDVDETGSKDDENLAESNNGSGQTDKATRAKEKRLVLKFKMAKRAKINSASKHSSGQGEADDAPRLEDFDWSEFDLQTINNILARREELRNKRRGAGMNKRGAEGDGQATALKLKRSSLAPAPLQFERVLDDTGSVDNDADAASEQHAEEQQEIDQERHEIDDGNVNGNVNGDAMDVDGDGDRPDYHYLFDPIEEAPLSPGGSSLQLPPRTSAMNLDGVEIGADVSASGAGIRHGRPHPAFIRSIADSHSGAPRDMRIVLQYELKSEEMMLKDIRAEILDKLSKLNTEEKLLRMVVKKDIDIEDDEAAMQNTGDLSTVFNGYIENDMPGSSAHAQQSLAATQGMGEHVGFGFGIGLDATADSGADNEENDSGGSDSDDSL
ncbi:hypothetical protein GGI22_005746, partial [Coemansia erecta]